jgi:exodeoxyribonuclease V gamma subunit
VGQGIKDNEICLPSVVLCELLDYIEEHYFLSKTALTTIHPLQSFSWKYFIKEANKDAYATELGIEISDNLVSSSLEDKELAQLHFEDVKTDNFAKKELLEIPEELYRIDLEDLSDFFTNPAKYFLQKCLQSNPQVRDLPELSDCESFEIGTGLERYALAEKILKKYLARWHECDKNELRKELQEIFHAEGVLPVKAWGDIEFDKFFDNFEPFAEKLSHEIGQSAEAVSKEHSFDNGILLKAKFNDLYMCNDELKQIQFRYSNIKAKHLIKASLYDLSAKAMGVVSEGSSLSLIVRDSKEEFTSVDANKAKEKLNRLSELYLEGLRKPLAFFPDTSLAYIKSGEKAALKKWETNKNYSNNTIIPGEGDDAYVRRCFGKTFKATEEFERVSKEIVDLLELGGGK